MSDRLYQRLREEVNAQPVLGLLVEVVGGLQDKVDELAGEIRALRGEVTQLRGEAASRNARDKRED